MTSDPVRFRVPTFRRRLSSTVPSISSSATGKARLDEVQRVPTSEVASQGFSSPVSRMDTSPTPKVILDETRTMPTSVATFPQVQPYQRSVNIWGMAQQKLQSDPFVPTAVTAIFSDRTDESDAAAVLHEAEAAKTNYFRRQRSYNRGPGGATTFQDSINKIILSAGKFSSVIDSLTDCDPTHYAKLAWGGIRIFLVAATQNIQLHESVLEGMAYVSDLITNTLETMIKLIFINQPPSIMNLKTVNLLQGDMVKLYASTLHYLGLANLYYKAGAWGRAGMSLAGPENSDIIRVLNSVQAQELMVRRSYDMVCGERAFQEAQTQSVGLAETHSALDAVMGAQRQLGEQLQILPAKYVSSQQELASSVAQIQLTAERISQSHQVLDRTMRELCNRVQLFSKSAMDEMQAEKRTKLLQWVSKEPYKQYHQACIDAILFDSSSWIYQTERFKAWYCNILPSMLLLSGQTRSGKTSIVAQIIDDLQSNMSPMNGLTPAVNHERSMVLYYYCKQSSNTNQGLTATDILASLLRQLCSEDSITFTSVLRYYETEQKNGFPSGPMSISVISSKLSSSFEILTRPRKMAIYIVVDGLNVLNSRETTILMKSLKELTQMWGGFIKILVTTQSYSYPKGSLAMLSDIYHDYFVQLGHIHIEPSKLREKFIRAEISRLSREIQVPAKELGKYRGLSNSAQDRIVSELMAQKPEPISESFRRNILESKFLPALHKEGLSL